MEAVVREIREELSVSLSPDELTHLGEFAGTYGDPNLTLHAFLWPFDGILGRFHQTEGAGMDLVSLDEMLRRTEPGGPDYTLTLALKGRLRGCDEVSGRVSP